MNECLYLLEAVFLIRVHWTDNYLSLIVAMSLKAPFINSNSLYNNSLRPLLKWFSRYLLISIGGCGKPNAYMLAACVAHMLVDWVLLLILIWYLFIVRYVIWIPIYLLSWRKHSFFLFPNLTEDCGFFESFVPLYEYKNLSLETTKKSKKGKGGECRHPDK